MNTVTTLEDKDWQNVLNTEVNSLTSPLLLRSTGEIIRIETVEQLGSIEIAKGDCYIHGPHGQMVPFAAMARSQDLFNEKGALMHIDAHADNRQNSGPMVPRTDIAGKKHKYSAGNTSAAVRYLLSLDDPAQIKNQLAYIVDITRGDIDTWICALEMQFETIVTQLRTPGSQDVTIGTPDKTSIWTAYYGMPGGKYSVDSIEQQLHLTNEPINFISMDSDFCGIQSNSEDGRTNDSQAPEKEESVFQSMMQHTIETNNAVHKNGHRPVYSISTDKDWCKAPARFCIEWIQKFYIPTVQDKVHNIILSQNNETLKAAMDMRSDKLCAGV